MAFAFLNAKPATYPKEKSRAKNIHEKRRSRFQQNGPNINLRPAPGDVRLSAFILAGSDSISVQGHGPDTP